MRTKEFNNGMYSGVVRYPFLHVSVHGNNYITITCNESVGATEKAKLSVTNGVVKELYMTFFESGGKSFCRFNLDWLKYAIDKALPITNIPIKLEIGDGGEVASFNLSVNQSRGEVGAKLVEIVPTQFIEGISTDIYAFAEESSISEKSYVLGVDGAAGSQGLEGVVKYPTEDYNINSALDVFEQLPIGEPVLRKSYKPQRIDCLPNNAIVLRILSRYGGWGVIAGIGEDVSKAGKEYLHRENNANYQGIFSVESYAQQIIKEVNFDCDGDVGLVGLLRDAQVYNRVEVWDFTFKEWRPCDCTGGKLNLQDGYAEQFLTIKLQQYD